MCLSPSLCACLSQALIDEDRLLSRLEVMGSQLQAYSKVIHASNIYSRLCTKYTPHTRTLLLSQSNLLPSAPLLQSQTEEGIKKELLSLQEDKHNYETTAKESLRRVLQEKIEVVRKLAEVEVNLHTGRLTHTQLV